LSQSHVWPHLNNESDREMVEVFIEAGTRLVLSHHDLLHASLRAPLYSGSVVVLIERTQGGVTIDVSFPD
jgi:hypothetical protein